MTPAGRCFLHLQGARPTTLSHLHLCCQVDGGWMTHLWVNILRLQHLKTEVHTLVLRESPPHPLPQKIPGLFWRHTQSHQELIGCRISLNSQPLLPTGKVAAAGICLHLLHCILPCWMLLSFWIWTLDLSKPKTKQSKFNYLCITYTVITYLLPTITVSCRRTKSIQFCTNFLPFFLIGWKRASAEPFRKVWGFLKFFY